MSTRYARRCSQDMLSSPYLISMWVCTYVDMYFMYTSIRQVPDVLCMSRNDPSDAWVAPLEGQRTAPVIIVRAINPQSVGHGSLGTVEV